MNVSTGALIAVLVILTALLGYNYYAQPLATYFLDRQVEQPVASFDPLDLSPTDVAALYFNSLTPEKKISMMMAAPLKLENESPSASVSANRTATADLVRFGPGFITLFGKNLSASTVEAVAENVIVPTQQLAEPWIAVDHEGGTVQRLSGAGFTALPAWSELCGMEAAKRRELISTSSAELKHAGIRVIFAPVVDFATGSATLKSRVCSGDPELVVRHSAGVIRQYQEAGIIPVIKHFPGIGQTKKDLHLSFDTVEVTEREASVYRKLLGEFPRIGAMVSHAGVINQFEDTPCSLSRACIDELKLNFPRVLIFSDDLLMKSASYGLTASSSADVAGKAIIAGNDVLVFGPGATPESLTQVRAALAARYLSDLDFKQRVDESVARILDFKLHTVEAQNTQGTP